MFWNKVPQKKAHDNLPVIQLPEGCDPNLQLPNPGLLDYYRDDAARTIWLIGEVNEKCYDFITSILRYNKEDDEAGIAVEDRKPIRIIIDSPGGLLGIGRTMCEVIHLSKTPVYTIGIGLVASAASLIFACGHRRFATANTTFLLHNGSCEDASGTFNQMVAMIENYRREIQEMHEFYAEHTKFPPELLEEKLENDWYITVDEAIENGLADEAISSIDIFYKN